MKVLTICLAGLLAFLSACVLIPSPTVALLPLTVAATELSPCLIVFNLLAAVLAVRYYRPAVPILVVALLVSCWPLVQVHRIAKQGNTASVLFDCVKSIRGISVQPKRLPMNILYYAPSVAPGVGHGPRPAFVDIYGGAWQHGSPDQSHRFDSYLARRGFAGFAIDYRHAPAFRFPAQLDDVNAALLFLYQNASQYNIDPNRFVLCGRSAGAELALLAAYEPGPVPVRAVISYYGPTDLTAGYFDLPSPDPLNVRKVLETYLGGAPIQLPNVYKNASPVNHIRPLLPPTLIVQGKRDHIVKDEFARELYTRLLQSGNRAILVEVPWSEHTFDLVFPGLGNQVSLPYLQEFLKQTVGS